MSQNNSQLNKQNELIRSLRKQLEATERELANQKWVFEQFLQSPAWKITYPIRWVARQLRAITTSGAREPVAASTTTDASEVPTVNEQDLEPAAAKEFLTSLYRTQLHSFLNSNALLQLPHSESPEVSVLLVLYNRAELTLACLRSIAETFSERIEIIIVDNASSDETPQLLERLRGARVLRNAENRNFLLGVNQAAREARGEYLLLLNNDAQLLPGSLRSLITTIHSSDDIGAVGGKIILLDGTLQEAGSIIWADGSCLGYGRGDNPFAPMYNFRRDVHYCSGAFLLTPRELWQKLGGFDEIFKPAYYEETDYCTRLWEEGLRVVYDPKAIVLHYEFASSSSMSSATDLQRQHQHIFAGRHQEFLSTHLSADVTSILPARMKNSKKRVLVIDDQVPHRWLGSGFPRAQAILQALMHQGRFVTFYPLHFFTVSDDDWSTVYSDNSPEIEFMMNYGPSLLEAFLRNRCRYYESILVSRPHNMKVLRTILDAHPEWFKDTKIIYDAEALFIHREITFAQLDGIPMTEAEIEPMLQKELDLAKAADCVITVSDAERDELKKRGIPHVCVLGHSLHVSPTPQSFEQRSGFLFVGAIHDEATPNGDSVIWFLQEVWPKIQSILGMEVPLTIVGVNKSDRIREKAGTAVNITGHVSDLTNFYNSARVFIAPTRYGAGLPHKVHEAAARGLPVVATPLLTSQLGWKDGESILVGSDVESFAKKCIDLHTSRELWDRLREEGLARVREECSPDTFESNLRDILVMDHSGPKNEPNPSKTEFHNARMDR